jgi:hypothetical protein
MKNLANCKPSEFLKQTNRIRKSVERWLKLTDVMSIRKRMPEGMPEVEAGMSQDEVEAVQKKRQTMMADQSQRNLSAIFDAVLDAHPDETLEVLGLCCFVEPDHVDDHTVSEYLESLNELIQDENVRGFFTFLMSLVQ